MNSKLTLLHAYGPSGHSSVSKALKRQFLDLNSKAEISELEIASGLHPFWGPMVTRAYLELVQKTPKLWDYLYDNRTVAQALDEFKAELTLIHRKKLREALKRLKTGCAICTHALPCAMLALEKRQRQTQIPLVGVLTDFGVHAYWISEHVDLYLVPTHAVRQELIRRSIEPAKVVITGIPIDSAFRRPLPKAEARLALQLRPDRPTILVTGGTKGIGPIRDIVIQLLSSSPDSQLVIVCGTNEELFHALKSKYDPDDDRRPDPNRRVKILAYTEDMPTCMAAADLLIGKAGGVTASEALAFGLPMIILAPLPGQEERNSAHLVAHGAAKRVATHQELSDFVNELLSSRPLLEAFHRNALSLGRPASAELACREILKIAAGEFTSPAASELARQ